MLPVAMIVELQPPSVTEGVGVPWETEVELPVWNRPPPVSLMPATDSSTPCANTFTADAPLPPRIETLPSRLAAVVPDESAVGVLATAPRSMIAPPEFDSCAIERLLDIAWTV